MPGYDFKREYQADYVSVLEDENARLTAELAAERALTDLYWTFICFTTTQHSREDYKVRLDDVIRSRVHRDLAGAIADAARKERDQ